jgi:alpha-tubulin suppressor-like RCC1 family protein
LALGNDGTVWAWGDNGNSQLGDGTTTTRLTPVTVTGLANVTEVYGGGFYSLALTAGGQVYGWGSNLFGALGDGTTTQRSTPVAAQISGVALVVAGEEHAMALKTDGTVWAWGENGSGQLGDGTTQDRHSPVQVTGFANAAAISAGYEHSAAVKTDGSVWAWGNNSTGELGFGVTDNRSTPQTIPSFANVVAIAAGGEHSVALAADGSVWTWGSNEAKGQLGDGTTTSRSSPEQVPGLGAVVGIAANLYHTVAVKADGSVWAWGYNDDGALGDGTYVNRFSPVQVTGLGNIVAVSAGTYFTLALRADGSVWSWGNNAYGQLGNGTTVGNNSPSQVTGLSNVVAISAGSYHSLALKSDGSVWGWGNDYDGRLGDGATLVNRLTPVQAIGIGNVVAISAGVFDSLALRSDGTVWSWGDNSNGNLGDGTTTNRSTPVQVSGLSGAAGIAAGKFGNRTTYYSMAVKTDGTVVGWGDNFTGQLGDGTYAQRLTPEIVLRENGAGSLQTADWFLDLAPGTAKNIPAGEIPAFEMIGTASGSDSSRTVSATVAYNPADLGKTGSVFINARVPAGTFPGQSNRAMTFGASQPAVNALAGGPKPRMRTTATPGTTYTQYQLTPSGWQPVVNGQLIPYVTGVLGSQLAAQTILSNTDTTAIPGAEFCLGYGSSASAMIANGTVRSVVSVAGAPVGTVVSCLPSSTGGVFPQSGYWWNPAEAGRGYVIEYNGTNVFMAAFLYDQSGRSTWYGGGPAPLTGSTFTAPMSAYSGGQTLTGSYRSATQGTSPGNISITFSDATDGTLTWPGGTIPITRYPFATNGLSSPPTATQPQTGWWWNPSEGGRGFSIEIQDNTAFVAAYMYDASGNPVWYAAGPATLSSGNVYQGSWTSYAGGQTLTGSYQSPTSTTNAGSLTIQFSSTTAGTLTLPDGRQISIERFGF